ncbi:hypothetical protein Tco_1502381 [Tanacetum coccineum]
MASLSRRLCGSETAHALVVKKGKAKDEYYGKLILDLGNEVRSSMEEGTAVMENLVKKLGNAEEKAECKKLKKELEEARFSNTFLRIQNERVERDLYWTRVRAHEFYREMIRRGFLIMPPKSAPLTQADVRRMIKESIDAASAAERARHANARNDARGSGPVREGKKVKFAAAILQGPALTWWNFKIATMGLETRFNELALMCPRMVKPESMKVDAYIRGLFENIKGEVTSSRPTNLNEAVCMAHKLMEQKSQARDERILEGKKRKWENFQSEQ